MRSAKVALAVLLSIAVPIHAETTTDPLWYLLSTYVLAPDAKAVQAEGEGPADAKGLAELQSDLLLLSDGFESFRDEAQVKETLVRLEPRMSPELRPFFKDRASSLDAIYRTLAVTDYTWAQRFPEPPCTPAEVRRKLLDNRDGLFQTEKGEASTWLVALLGPQAEGKSAEQALDQASSKAKLTGAEYEKRRAKVRRLTLALASEKAVGSARSKLYCSRAAAFEDLAGYHRHQEEGATLASRAAVHTDPETSVFVVVWNSRRAAATLVETKSGPVLLTDASIVQDTDHPQLLAFSEKAKPLELTATVTRRDAALGLAVLKYSEDLPRPTLALANKVPSKDDLVSAIGHTEVSGLWTKTSGLVTKSGPETFQTDAAVSSDFSGGPVLNESGEVAGLLVLRPADTEEGRWPVAVPAATIARWLGGAAPSVIPETEAIEDAGTAAILSRTRPSALTETAGTWPIPNLPPPPPEPRGVCMSNCGGPPSRSYTNYTRPGSDYSRSTYSDNGSKELGEALGKLGAVLIMEGIPALFRGLGKLFKKKSAPQQELADNRHHAGTKTVLDSKPTPKVLPPPPIKKDPPKLKELTLEAIPATAASGDKVTLIARLTLNDPQASRNNIVVNFKATPETLVHFAGEPRAKTDASGTAAITVTLRRDHGVRTVKAGDTRAVKNKSFSAHDALDEETRAINADSSGATESGVDEEKDETIEFKGRATVGVSHEGTASVILSQTEAAGREKALAQSVGFSEIKEICYIDMSLSTEENCVYRCDIYIDGKLVQSSRLRSEPRNGGLCPPNFTDIKVVPK